MSTTRKQLDPRLRILIENNVKTNHRSFIVLVGDRGRDRVCQIFFIGTATTKIGLTYGTDRFLGYTTYYRMLATGSRHDARFCGVTRRSLVSQGRYHLFWTPK